MLTIFKLCHSCHQSRRINQIIAAKFPLEDKAMNFLHHKIIFKTSEVLTFQHEFIISVSLNFHLFCFPGI